MKNLGKIEYIAEQIQERRHNETTWNIDKEIELFDSIDSLAPEEFNLFLKVLKIGGYGTDKNFSQNEFIEEILKENNLDLFIYNGIKK